MGSRGVCPSKQSQRSGWSHSTRRGTPLSATRLSSPLRESRGLPPRFTTGLPLLWVADYVNRHPGSEETRVLPAPSERTGRVACDASEMPRPLMAPPALKARDQPLRSPERQLQRREASTRRGSDQVN